MAEEFQLPIEKLTNEESFQIWNFPLCVVLKANGLYEVVSKEQELESLNTEEEKSAWKKKDAKAQKYIVMSVDKKHLLHIINCKYAHEMYDKLKNIFEKSTQDQVCNLLQQFYSCSYNKDTDMTLHISKIENLAHKLKALNQQMDDNMIISKIISTLPKNYRHFITAWESTAVTERTITNLIARIWAEENRNMQEQESQSDVAFRSEESFKNKNTKNQTKYYKKGKEEDKCFKCGKKGHYARNCDDRENPRLSRNGQCSTCKKNNHTEKDCFFRENENHAERNKVAFLVEGKMTKDFYDTSFVVDSGCSSHMSNTKELFSTLTESESTILVAKKNQTMMSEGKGNIEGSKCTLKNVLFVPELSKNLLSVNAITDNNGQVIFSKKKVIIKKDDTLVLEGIKENGQYIVKLQQNNEGFLAENRMSNCETWHRKLGHLGINNIKKLMNMSEGINLSKKDVETVLNCEKCLEAKQTRLTFYSVRQRAARPLEIIHTDVCGPIDPVTWDGKRYFLTILDDYTHFCKVYLLKSKNEVFEYLKEFVNEAEAYQNVRISKIRCDNGGEFSSMHFKNWCKKEGIILDSTVPYSPQQNGKAERLNCTLMEKARAMIFDSKMDKEMWGEAVYVAAYLLNRSPTETIEVTPIEKWSQRRPNLINLQIFGSIAHAKVLGYLKKLDTRSKKYRFVGYTLSGYRLWDEKERKIVVYRDVVFKQQEDKELEKNVNIHENIEDREDINQEINRVNEKDQPIELLEEHSSDEENTVLGEGLENQKQDRNENIRTRSGRQVKLPNKFQDYNMSGEFAMLTYEEALNGLEKEQWKLAIDEEKKSLKENDHWVLVNKEEAKGRNLLTSKWVFRIKDEENYKARLVVRGF